MKVLMLSSEATPFFKSGGLADVVGDLSRKLPLLGADVRVILPAYGMAPEEAGVPEAAASVRVLGGDRRIAFRSRTLDGARFCFVCDSLFTGRKGIYGPSSFAPFADNFLRFALLDKAALAYCAATGWIPDIIHCHDWTAALLPFLLRKAAPPLRDARTLFTIHNLAYQGEFPRFEFINAMEEPDPDLFTGGTVNLMRAGLLFSDCVSTVSPTYAREIQTPEQGCGLDPILRERKDSLYGILNGIDPSAWDPGTDRHLPCPFGPGRMEGKARVKAAVQTRFGLEADPARPLFSMVSRLAAQKGVEELLQALEGGLLDRDDAQFLVVGTGDRRYEERLASLARSNKNIAVRLAFSEEAAHLAVAAGDYLLMPSRYEPCGLSQMHALRCGTLPVATRTGGLADSVDDLEEDPGRGTGLLMDAATPAAITEAVGKAAALYGSALFCQARERAMARDFSWDSSARKYMELYERMRKGGTSCR